MRQWLSYSLLFLAALAPRLYRLGAQKFWYDEAFTAGVVGLPPLQLAAALAGDVHPPLWYVIEYLTAAALGPTEAALRLPAALAGALAAVLLWAVVRAAGFGERAAWWAAALYIALPTPLYYGREGRMYSLLTCFMLLGCLAVLKRRRAWLAAAALGLLYTHNLGGLYVAALAGAALLSGRGGTVRAAGRDALQQWGPAAGVTVAGFLPWLGVLSHQMQNMTTGGFWLPPLQGLGSALFPLYFVIWGPMLPEVATWHAAALAVALTGFSVMVAGRALVRPRGRVVLAVLVGPPLLALLVSALWRPVYLNRLFVPSGAALLAVWGAGLARFRKSARWAVLAALVPLVLASAGQMYTGEREPASRYIDMISDQAQPGDAVYHMNLASWVVYGYYLPDLPHYVWPQDTTLRVSLSSQTKNAMGVVSKPPDQTGAARLWLLWPESPYTAAAEYDAASTLVARHPSKELIRMDENPLASFSIWLVELEDSP